MKKKVLGMLLAGMLSAAMLTGCGSAAGETAATTDATATDVTAADATATDAVASEATAEGSEDDEENYETGDASLDNTRNEDNIGEKELLVVSFGTSFNDNRRLTIGAIEEKIDAELGKEYSVRRAFTSQIIIDHIKKRDHVAIDNVTEALKRSQDNGVKTLVVQPTHLMDGLEYKDIVNEVGGAADAYEQVVIGEPLLTTDADFEAVMKAITDDTKSYDDGRTAICFMGHGTEAESNEVYIKMQELLTQNGFTNYYIGTVEAAPTLEDVIAKVKSGNYEKVILQPLMVVAGDHANNDMAGGEEDSWKSSFEKEGFKVECVIKGLGELEAIQELYVEHAKAAVAKAEGNLPTNQVAEQSETAAAAAKATETAAKSETAAEAAEATAKDLVPVTADKLNDGEYEIKVDSSSSMFNIEECTLTVKDGKMNATMTMGGKGYLYLYMGTAQEAATKSESAYIPFTETKDARHAFEVPVEALDRETDCAAFSKKKEKWYDRVLVFRADSLKAAAFKDGGQKGEKITLQDGEYKVKATLEGGSGKAAVLAKSPLIVKQGKATVTIEWSSKNYDYMIIGDKKYLNESAPEENSTFTIPVEYLDGKIKIIADTTAMSTPHEIEYTLTFELEK